MTTPTLERVAFRTSRLLDFSIRVSDREAYVVPDRGAQGNALKTLVAMPFVLGQRVELNALTSEQPVELIEARLEEAGVEKVVPDEARLEEAYRRAYRITLLNRAIDAATVKADKRAGAVRLPKDITALVEKHLEEHPEEPWDDAITDLVAKAMEGGR